MWWFVLCVVFFGLWVPTVAALWCLRDRVERLERALEQVRKFLPWFDPDEVGVDKPDHQ